MAARIRFGAALCCVLWLACSAAEQTEDVAAGAPAIVPVGVAGETFDVELATNPAARVRGLSGRESIPRNGGMLFVLPKPVAMRMVMRDCPQPIDVAFADAMGRVVAIHAMVPEPPRRAAETPHRYESRLPEYASGEPAQFALEVAGGRLAELGLRVGDRLHFPAQALIEQAR
jgi:uncharacterized membrane protein (UPF0127 family)